MDWDRIEDLMSHHTQRLVFIDYMSFLLDFLETLFKALKNCASIDQCSSLYPRAGPLLTTFAIHPYIGCNEKLASLVIDCIMEYTKYSFDPIATSSNLIPRSSTWCLQRLRRLIYSPKLSEMLSRPRTLELKVDKIASSIQKQSKNGNITISKMEQLCDMSLLLLEDETALKVIEALMDAALELEQRLRSERVKQDIVRWNDNDSAGTGVLSDRFAQYVLGDMDNENSSYQQQWPMTLKTKAWQAFPDLFECEWMDWVEKQLESGNENISVDRQLSSSSLLEGLKQCPRLMYLSFTLMARWIFDADLADWRIVRLWIKVMDWHLLQQESLDSTYEKIRLLDFTGNLAYFLDMMIETRPPLSLSTCRVDQLYSGLLSFIYVGSPLTLTRRRNQAWLLSLMCPLYNFWCVGLWIDWCTESESTWSDKMDQMTMYIAWLVCPSLDERLKSYHLGLKKWIQSLKGFDRRDPSACRVVSRFLDDWYILFNGQVQMGADILGAMIHHSQSWTTDQCISIINRFLNGANTHSTSTKTSVTVPLLERLTALDDARMDTLISHVHSILP